MADNESNSREESRSATDNIKELTQASKDLLHAGEQIKQNLSELSDRAEHATNVGKQIATSPWFLSLSAIAAGILLLTFSRHRYN